MPLSGSHASASRPVRAWPVAVVFMVHAGVTATWGPRIPAIKERLALDDAGLAAGLSGLAVAMFVGTRVAGVLMARCGPAALVRVAVVVLGLTLLGPALAPNLVVLAVGLAVMGLTMGLLDVAMNAEAVDVEQRIGRPVLVGLHGAWSAGMLLAGVVAALAASVGVGVTGHLVPVALALVVAGIVAGRGLPSVPALAPAASASASADCGDAPGPAPRRVDGVMRLGVVAAAAFASEGAAADWSAVYLHDHLQVSDGTAALGFVGFAVGMTVARLTADRVVGHLAPGVMVRGAGLLGVAGVFGVVAAPSIAGAGSGPGPVASTVAVVGFTVMGIAFAPVVPVIFRVAGAGPGGHRRLGWVVTIGYLGTMAGPAVIGWLAAARGLRVGVGFVAVLGVAVAAAGPPALRRVVADKAVSEA